MFDRLSSLAKAGVFYLITFILALLLAIFGQRLGNWITLVTMFTPMAAVLLMLLVITRDGYTRSSGHSLGLQRLGWQSWGLAVLAPLLVMTFTYGIVWIIGMGRLDLAAFGGLLLAGGLTPLLIGVMLDLVTSFGEEIGWRGYLLPHLLPIGHLPALLVSGLLHGLWHLPAIFLTPFYHENGDRLIVATLFVVSTTLGGVFYGSLRLTSGSVWPAVLAHAAFNRVWTTFSTMTIAVASPVWLEYLAGESGIFTLIGLALVVAWLLYRWRRQPYTGQTTEMLAGGS